MDNSHEIKKYNHKWGFGMAPLKSNTDYNYKKATYSVWEILMDLNQNEIKIDDISIFKGLINRCIRQDQWDWFTVYTKFGEPDPQNLKPIPHQLTELRNAIKEINKDKINLVSKKLLELNVLDLCEVFLKRKEPEFQKDFGYIYILSKREEPKLLKIGMTNRSVEKRVKEINSATGVLFPYSVRRVYKVIDAELTEKLIFQALDDYRIRKDREFFMIEYSIATKLIDNLLLNKKLNINSN